MGATGPTAPSPPTLAEKGRYVLWSSVLDAIDRATRDRGVDAILVKGVALAHTVYPTPWERPMADIDLLAPEPAAVVAALEAAGFASEPPPPGRPFSFHALGELPLRSPGPASMIVEVHAMLDKVVARPIAVGDIARRSHSLRPGSRLLVPANEDQLLLVVLHAAASDFLHEPAWRDLALLLDGPLDLPTVRRRARRWRLETALSVCMRTVRHLGVAVPAALVPPLSPARLRALRRWYRVGDHPVFDPPAARLGWPWILRQTTLRDDLPHWLTGVARYAALRAADRVPRLPK